MEVKKIYKPKTEEDEYIYLLDDGRKIINRSNKKIKKLNIKKWDEVSFIPEDYIAENRNITEKERREIISFLKNDRRKNDSKSLWEKVKTLFT